MKPFEVPLFNAPFRQYSLEESDEFARRTGWIDDIGIIDPANSIVQSKPVPWWEGCELITVQSERWQDKMGAWILCTSTNKLIRLDGTSPPIHSLNAEHGPQLNAELALPYLGFFCTFVHGEDGMFGILNSANEAVLPSGWPSEKYADQIKPANLVDENDKEYNVEVTVCYSTALFWAHFKVKSNGQCDMVDDEPIAADVGVKIPLTLKFSPKEESLPSDTDSTTH